MDDHAPVVEQHPVGLGCPLAPDRLDALVAQALHDPVGDRADLPLGPTGADHERVGQRRQRVQVKQHDVGGLLVLGELHDAPGKVERLEVRFGRRGVAGREAIRALGCGVDGVGHVVWVLRAGSV